MHILKTSELGVLGYCIQSPTETGDVGTCLSFWCLHYRRVAPRSLRKIFLVCENGKKREEDLYLKGIEKESIIASFLK